MLQGLGGNDFEISNENTYFFLADMGSPEKSTPVWSIVNILFRKWCDNRLKKESEKEWEHLKIEISQAMLFVWKIKILSILKILNELSN